MREQRALGWETLHLTSPKQGHMEAPFEDVDGLRFHRTRVAAATWAKVPVLREVALMRQLESRIDALARRFSPDILHAHSPVLNALPALKVGRKLKIPVVYEIRAFWEDAAVDHGTTREGSLRYRVTKRMETSAVRQVDHVFTICEGLRADIVGRGVPAGKVTVIPNAVDIESFQMASAPDPDLVAQYGLAGKTVIGFVGSFYGYEGLDLLVEAMPSLLARRPEIRLLLVGGGPQEASLRAQAERLGIADQVIFSGRVPHDKVNRYYNLIELLAYPRRRMRLTDLVTPLKPLEAMAQGQLFVASDVGGHRELVEHGRTGILFKAGDSGALVAAILGLLASREHWPELRANGRRFVEEVRNWRNSVACYREPYQRLLAARRR